MIHLAYILHDHGWATVSIGNGESTVEIEASYLSDALGDMARAARGTLRGLPETTFSFQQEPGEYRFVVHREGEWIRVEVYRFSDSFARSTRGKLVLTAECSLREFATACINCLRHVLDAHGEAGYRERWRNHAFPLQEYRDLRGLRRELTAGRRES